MILTGLDDYLMSILVICSKTGGEIFKGTLMQILQSPYMILHETFSSS